MHSRQRKSQPSDFGDLSNDSFDSKPRHAFRKEIGSAALAVAGVIGLLGIGLPATQYSESWGKYDEGRTKNSISAVVSGIVAQRIFGESTIDLELQKSLWSDTRIHGHTTSSSIDTVVDLNWHPAHFTADVDGSGNISGNVDKIEFDWNVSSNSENVWTIERVGWKFNYTLQLDVKDGKISGDLTRPGVAPNYTISGTYQDNGKVQISIDPSLGLGVKMEGTITPSGK